MNAKVIVNEQYEFTLTRWSATEFNNNTTLYIQSADLTAIKDAFNSIEKLQVFVDETEAARYVIFNSYAQISYLGQNYSENARNFVDTMSVTLQKTDLANQVKRLDEQINNIVDPETLTLEELKAYKLKQISEACTDDIYAGTTVELPDGTRQHFNYNTHDQLNMDELLIVCMVAPEINVLPFHSTGNMCKLFTREEIITFVTTLLMRKTQLVTYCNQLTQYVNTMTEREDLLAVTYGMELPEEYQARINEIMSETLVEMEKFLAKLMPQDEQDSDPEPEVEPEETE